MFMKHVKRCLTSITIGVLALGGTATAVIAQDFPGDREIELVAGYGPGGGHDTLLRTMAKVLAEEGIITEPINVINKPGGSSAVAMGYLNGRAGDGHFLMSVTSSHLTTPLTSNLELDYTSFTPIARLGIDPELLLVNSTGPFKTLEDLKSADKVLNVGGTATGSIEHIIAIQFGELTDAEINFIPFQGDGEVVAALLSNQLDFVVSNPGGARDFIEAGNFKALAVSTDERIDLLPEVPTFKEQGLDITLSLFRGVTAPADISPEAKEWLISKMKALSESKVWKDTYLDPNSVVSGFLPGDDFAAYLQEMREVYKETLTELDLLK